jgi:formylmethanofuran dehydrogenase subunit D
VVLILDPALLEQLDLKEGDAVGMVTSHHGIMVLLKGKR